MRRIANYIKKYKGTQRNAKEGKGMQRNAKERKGTKRAQKSTLKEDQLYICWLSFQKLEWKPPKT